MARFVSVVWRSGLALALASTLTGCLGPMVAGYPNGSENEPSKVLATKPATSTGPAQQLLVQKTQHTARILVSPDGGRDKHPLFDSYTYFVKTGEAPALELGFLHVSNDMIGGRQWLEKVFPIPNTDEWIGLKSDQPDDAKRLTEEELIRKYRFPPRKYTAVVFNAQRILRQHEFVCVQNEVEFTLQGGTPAFRIFRADGWCLVDVTTGRIRPEPNRPREATPTNQSITPPGFGWRIVMDAPPLAEINEILSDRTYSVYAYTKKLVDDSFRDFSRSRDAGEDDLAIWISVGLKPEAGLTREKFMADWLKYDTPQNLRHAADHDRVDFIGRTNIRQFQYFAIVHGRPVNIQLRFKAPYERWEGIVARFDEALRFEDVPRETKED